MEMLQPSYQLGFRFKAANEVGLIGIRRQNDLDGDCDQRVLVSPINRTEIA
jgi:hypothetical protein